MKLSKIFRYHRGVDCLSSETFLGNLNLRGPEPEKVQAESIEGVEFYKMVKRTQLYLV